MAFAAPFAMGVGALSTLIGGGIRTAGATEAATSKQAMYEAEADVQTKIAAAERDAAAATGAAGFRAAQNVGLRTGAGIARQTVEAGAGNIDVGTGSTAQVRASQIALGKSEQAETFQRYREAQYQQDLTAAEKTAEAGRYQMAAAQAGVERQFDLYGGIASTLGDTASIVSKGLSVSPKWFNQPTSQDVGD